MCVCVLFIFLFFLSNPFVRIAFRRDVVPPRPLPRAPTHSLICCRLRTLLAVSVLFARRARARSCWRRRFRATATATAKATERLRCSITLRYVTLRYVLTCVLYLFCLCACVICACVFLFYVNFRDAAAKVSAQQCLSNYLNLFYTSRRVELCLRSLALSLSQLAS